MIYFVGLTGLAVVALLIAEYRDSRRGVWVAKPLASAGFVGAALAAGALESPYGRWILLALLLCAAGDVLLIPRGAPRIFQGGVGSFLLGHLVLARAFLLRGVQVGVCGAAAGVALLIAIPVLRWLRPHVPSGMQIPIYAYVVVISAMVVFAAGAVVPTGDPRIFVGALMFYVSDLAVARDRFVAPGFWNGAWGLPLYFGAQLVLASTVA
jgi:uncharacterized membrane protein YhhN